MKAEDFDRKFDDGENIIEYLDLTKIKRSNSEKQMSKKVSVVIYRYKLLSKTGLGKNRRCQIER